MPINLTKGQKVDLTKGNPGLTKIVVGLGWDVNAYDSGAAFDLDAAAFGAEFRERVTMYYKDVRVTIGQNEGGAAVLQWSKNGFDHLLALPDTEMGLRGGLMPLFVEELEMVESKTA